MASPGKAWRERLRALVIFASLIGGLFLVGSAGEVRADAPFSPPVTVNDDSLSAGTTIDQDPSIAVAGGAIYAVWEAALNGSPIHASRSTDGGFTWSVPQVLNGGSAPTGSEPDVAAAAGGVVAVAWAEWMTNYRIQVARSTDGGSTWSSPANVSTTVLGSSPSIAVDTTGTMYVAWNGLGGSEGIYFAKSTDGGRTWSDPPVRVTPSPLGGWASRACLEVDTLGNLYLAWDDGRNGATDVFFAKSVDGGATWTNPNVKVPVETGNSNQGGPSLVVDPSGVAYVVWTDQRNGQADIYFASSGDGVTWTNPNIRVTSETATQAYAALVRDASGRLFVAWHDNRGGDWDVYMSSSLDGGASWSSPHRRVGDSNPRTQWMIALAADSGGALYAAWEDERNGHWSSQWFGRADVYFAKSSDLGATWTRPNVRVSQDTRPATQERPHIVAGPGSLVCAVWEDWRKGTDPDIYAARSLDGGVSWSRPNVQISDDAGLGFQEVPRLAVDATGGLYAAWLDSRSTPLFDYDVYFARSTDGGLTWSRPNVRVNLNAGAASYDTPAIAIGPDAIYVLWSFYTGSGYDFHLSKSSDGGVTWTESRVATEPTSLDRYSPSLVSDSAGVLYLTWWDDRRGNADIYFAKSTDGGATWTSPGVKVNPDTSIRDQVKPSIAVASGRIHVSWEEYGGVYVTGSEDGGGAWSAPVEVGSGVYSANPVGADEAGNVFVVLDTSTHLYLNRSRDAGRTWPGPSLVVEDGASGRIPDQPVLAVSDLAMLHVAWHESSGSGDILTSHWLPPPNQPPLATGLGVRGAAGPAPLDHVPRDPLAFNWSFVDVDGDSQEGFDLRLGTQSGSADVWDPPGESGPAQNRAYDGPALAPCRSYFLGVRVYDGIAWSSGSEVSFRTNGVPEPPAIMSPAPGSTVFASSQQRVLWSPGLDCNGDTQTFEWEVDNEATFSPPLVAMGSTRDNFSATFSTEPETTYYWRVRASDGHEPNWSAYGNAPPGYWEFRTKVNGTITGQVVDANGNAVAGATVELLNRQGEPAGAPIATTDTAGRFWFVGLDPSEYRVRATKPGYASGTTDANLLTSPHQANVVIRLEREVATPLDWIPWVLLAVALGIAAAGIVAILLVKRRRKRRESPPQAASGARR